jgi:hypothetical protein
MVSEDARGLLPQIAVTRQGDNATLAVGTDAKLAATLCGRPARLHLAHLEGPRLPDFEIGPHADKGRLTVKAGVAHQVFRKADAPFAVDPEFHRVAQKRIGKVIMDFTGRVMRRNGRMLLLHPVQAAGDNGRTRR